MTEEQNLEVSVAVDDNLTSLSPEMIDDAWIDASLNFLKQYDIAKKEDVVLTPPGSLVWPELPEFLKYRIKIENNKVENAELIPSESDLNVFYDLMSKSRKFIDYQAFSELYHQFPKKIQAIFEPEEIFANLFAATDRFGRISSDSIMDLYTDELTSMRYYSGLDRFSIINRGYLTFDELSVYLNNVLPMFEDDDLDRPYYVDVLAEMIMFKLDPNRFDQVLLADLIATDIVQQIFGEGENFNGNGFFTIGHVSNVLTQYKAYGKEGIMKEQLKQMFPTVPLLFWNRFFEVHCPDGLMYMTDYYKYLYSIENWTESCVIQYMFKVFDVNGDGYISFTDVAYFYTHLMAELENIFPGYELSLHDLYDGLYDMCGSKSTTGISRKDIIKSGMAGTFFSILMDANELKNFEIAESTPVNENAEE